jgi:uncharacterized membrane protein YecN with MAPEG domain
MTMVLSITPVYAALFALFYIFLSLRVALMRRSIQVSLGDGGNQQLAHRTRVHGNFIEYVPLVLILMALAELQGQAAWVVHLIGASLVVGRLMHAYGLTRVPQVLPLRAAGMVFTINALAVGALANLAAALAA